MSSTQTYEDYLRGQVERGQYDVAVVQSKIALGIADYIEKCRQQMPHWIPVSDRLPSDDEEVIVSITDDSGDTSFSYTTLGWHYKGIWIVDDSRCPMVSAWMPLPEPYQEVEHETN